MGRNITGQHATQYNRQLEAIESTILRLSSPDKEQGASNDPHFNASIQRGGIELYRENSLVQWRQHVATENEPYCAINVTPLFKGSYTQAEVVISSARDANLAVDNSGTLERIPLDHQQLHPLEPKYFYSRFRQKNISNHSVGTQQGVSLLIVCANNTTQTSALPAIHQLSPYKAAIAIATHITIAHWNYPEDSGLRMLETKVSRLCHSSIGKQSAPIKRMVLTHDPILLMQVLSHHDMALVPDEGLAIDALNADCACGIWFNDHDRLPELLSLPRYDGDHVQQRSLLKHIAQRQRVSFSEQQLGKYPGTVITCQAGVLQEVLAACFSLHSAGTQTIEKAGTHLPFFRQPEPHNRWSDSSTSLSDKSQTDESSTTESVDSSVIMTPLARQQPGRKLRLQTFIATSNRKLQKLRRSPGQFFADSKFPLVQSIGKLIKRTVR